MAFGYESEKDALSASLLTESGGREPMGSVSIVDRTIPFAHRIGRVILDLVLPPLCLRCGAVIDEPQALCAGCWSAVTFLGPPCCETCGIPFPYPMPEGSQCAPCLARKPAFDRARSAVLYDDAARALVLGFKHADRIHATRAYATWMARAGRDLLGNADLVVPVPLHRFRLWQRRYNQSALLAQALARKAGLPYRPDLLLRRRRTPSQGGLSRAERARNVRSAFRIGGSAKGAIEGRTIVLVDDVLTTGATASECAKTLKAAGAGAVHVITLARVPFDPV